MTDSISIESQSAAPAGAGHRRTLLLVLTLVIIHCALAWSMRTPSVTWGEDDAQYAVLGRSLAHGSYRETWNIDAPVGARYPPGFPSLLAAADVVFGEHLDLQLALVVLCSAASILLLFDVIRRRLGDAAAVFVTGLSAVNPVLLGEAGSLMSEAPFRLWVTVTLWAASVENPRTRHLCIAAGAAVLAALTRTAGIAVLAGLCTYWVLERRWKAVALLIVAAVPVAAWLQWTRVAPDSAHRGVYVQALATTARRSARSAGTELARTARRLWLYGRQEIPTSLAFFALKRNIVDNLLWAGVMLLLIPAGVIALWKRWRVALVLLAFYAAVLVVWPWGSWRFLTPWNGVLLALICAGTLTLTARWGKRAQQIALVAVAVPFVIGTFQLGAPALRARLVCDRSRPSESPECFSEAERGLYQLAAYVRATTEPNAIFFAPKEAAFYFHSGRKSIRETNTLDVPPDSLGPYLRQAGVTYAVVSPIGAAFEAHNRLIARACRDFDLVRTFEGDAVLLRVRSEVPAASDDGTCRTVAPWKDGVPLRWQNQ